ncbi:MAG: hypothetical protein JWN62_1322 [Acidimicrobiales bacterium]|nr:hypothetical protein [Acidimicrobiales bacterium]
MEAHPIGVVSRADTVIGGAIAVAMARHGLDVAVLGTSAERLQRLAADVLGNGGRAVAIQVDLESPAAMADAATEIVRQLGPVERWVIVDAVGAPSSAMTNALAAACIAIDVSAGGVIIPVCPTLMYVPDPDLVAASASAFATRAALECTRIELLAGRPGTRLSAVVLPTRVLTGSAAGPTPADLLVTTRAVQRAARIRRSVHASGWDTWLSLQCARLAPRLSNHLQARRSSSGAPVAVTSTVRELGEATRARARELLHLGARS